MTKVIQIPKAGHIDVPDPQPIRPLDFLHQIVQNINAQLSALDTAVSVSSNGDGGQVKALLDGVQEIKQRALQSADVITQLQSSDATIESSNAQLGVSVTAVDAINRLVASVQELEKELREAEFDYYHTVSELLVDVQSQMSKFEAYLALPHIAVVKDKILAIESELRRQIQWCFREISSLTSSEKYGHECDPAESTVDVDVSALAQVYLVVDALGPKFRADLLERFAQMQLLPYDKLFQLGSKYSGLQHLDQRFAWFEFLVRVVDAKMSSVLPSQWIVPFHLFVEFCRRTKNHILDILAQNDASDPALNGDVGTILRAIKSLNGFEAKMMATCQERVRAEGLSETLTLPLSMKEAFDAYLGPYVKMERKGLEDLMATVIQGEETPIPRPPNPDADAAHPPPPPFNAGEPYSSSQQIFEYIKVALKRCVGFSTGNTFLSLSREFGVVLQRYADELKSRCPQPEAQTRPDKPPVYKINKTMEKTLCKVICTGEYCIDTIPSLETIMKQRVQSDLRDRVDFSAQIESFQEVVAFAMHVLASGEVQRMQEFFMTMKSTNWSGDVIVGDVTEPVKQMLKVFVDCIPRIRLTMSPVYFQTFCSKIVVVFIDQFLDTIWKLRRVSKTGGAQLLLDTNGIKEFCVKLPNVRLPEGQEARAVGRTYLKVLEAKLSRVENVLKIIIAEDSTVDEMFAQLLPDATPKEKDSILILKGLKMGVPVPIPIKDLGDKVKDVGEHTAGKIKVGAEETVRNIKTGFQAMGGNLRNAFGDMFSGNLFQPEGSMHSDASGHGSVHSAGAAQPKKDLKAAATAVSAANAMKKGSGGTGGQPNTPQRK